MNYEERYDDLVHEYQTLSEEYGKLFNYFHQRLGVLTNEDLEFLGFDIIEDEDYE